MDGPAQNSRKKSLRIGCASAFWGDTSTSAHQLLAYGELDYLVFDYLAEVTLAIMAGQRMADPHKGYAVDFIRDTIIPNIDLITSNNTKIIANAGGINPKACKIALEKELARLQLSSSLKVAVVFGDDLMPSLAQLKALNLQDTDSGEQLPAMMLTINAYTGCSGIVEALRQGADIIITGRVADSALTLAPALYEFNWPTTDYNKLSQASLAGHLLECGAQATGGNFTDWHKIPDADNIGFPIIEMDNSGEFTISKPPLTGGLVNFFTVAEQLVYEIGNPKAYILPDVVCDWSQVTLTEEETKQDNVCHEKVRVKGALGAQATGFYKMAATYPDGFKISTAFVIYGPRAAQKAQHVAESIFRKTNSVIQSHDLQPIENFQIDYIGANATKGHKNIEKSSVTEVVLKLSARHDSKQALILFSKELAQASTSNAPGLCQLVAGRPKVNPLIRLFTSLIPAGIITETVAINELEFPVTNGFNPQTAEHCDANLVQLIPRPLNNSPATVPSTVDEIIHNIIDHSSTMETYIKRVSLYEICCARSGDKGNHANIGLIARDPILYHFLQKVVTENFVSRVFEAYLDHPKSTVVRWNMPGISAMNFMLYNSLGDGGFASLRLDAQGKGFAQLLLEAVVDVPLKIYDEFMSRSTQRSKGQYTSQKSNVANLTKNTTGKPILRIVNP